MTDQNHAPPIKYIDTPASFAAACATLAQKDVFAFDTEFDRFYREYGFKLSLLQIFDGDEVFLIDPLAIKNLQPLWVLFEDPRICKVVYSCSEDIQLLKINGCNPRNIYDLQIAAKLCNYPANSLGDLIFKAFDIRPDKSHQKSNWRRRPLSADQLLYAGNDVSRLLYFKDLFDKISAERGVTKMIEEENRVCENIPVAEYKVKLSVAQKRKYDHAHQKILLALLHWRNDVAMEYNVPPANIVSDTILESVIEDKNKFLQSPFGKGFSKRLVDDAGNQKKFLELAQKINDNFTPREQPEKRPPPRFVKVKDENSDKEFDRKYALLYDEIIGAYGTESGEFILRGFKKLVNSFAPQPGKMKSYQQNIIDEACRKLGLDFGL